MSIVLITGSAGLIGSEAVNFFAKKGFVVVGIDNDMRKFFFGDEASTCWNRNKLKEEIPNYIHHDIDIRDIKGIRDIFNKYNKDISLIVHCAAQPSHDWAAREPLTDFAINANGTLNLLESMRTYCSNAVFIFCSTNKVYGDKPNSLPFNELETRWEIKETHKYYHGIDENMSIDQSKHSLFGVSKAAADILVQEYGRYFGIKTVCFRGGCLTGSNHSSAMLHGFLSYLMKCCMAGTQYTVFGYRGKQVRDIIHSYDVINAFYHFYENPRSGEVYNIGGGRFNNCSVLEAITLCEEITGKKLNWNYSETNRVGDHIWYVSNMNKFQVHYPAWDLNFDLKSISVEMLNKNNTRWALSAR